MEGKNIKMEVGGLVCDNKSCDFKDMSIKETDYKDWVNKPCPKCGENLLTEEDFKSVEILRSIEYFMNNLSEEEINLAAKSVDLNLLKESEFFKDTEGLDLLLSDENVLMAIKTHGGIKVTDIKIHKPNETE